MKTKISFILEENTQKQDAIMNNFLSKSDIDKIKTMGRKYFEKEYKKLIYHTIRDCFEQKPLSWIEDLRIEVLEVE